MNALLKVSGLLLLLLGMTLPGFCQLPGPSTPEPLPEIIEIEYFFDTDPGFGNGTSVSVADSIVDENIDIDISGLSVGRHLLYVRSLDENGVWSQDYATEIRKLASPSSGTPLPEIVAMEYFVNTDPGYGNGTPVSIPVADSLIDENISIDLSLLSPGRHLVYFRTMDANGVWTLDYPTQIQKLPSASPGAPLPDIVAMEYFVDSDPGYGNGTPVSVPVADSLIDEDISIDLSLLSPGRHLLFFRTMDENGVWTLDYVTQMQKLPSASSGAPLPDIVAMEYFVDTDPGLGNGIPIFMTADSLVDVNFNIDVSSWGTEVHILYIRALDELGNWTLVYLEPLTKGDISRRMRHGKFFFNGIEQPMFTEDIPD